MLDAEPPRPAGVDELGVEKNVTERVPLGGGLAGHVDGVVSVLEVRRRLILVARDGVGAGGQHRVDRTPSSAEEPGLDRLLERQPKGEDPALADQPSCGDDVLRSNVIEGPDLVVLAPAAPVRQVLAGIVNGGTINPLRHGLSRSTSGGAKARCDQAEPRTLSGDIPDQVDDINRVVGT
jgi:hypothetical protein